MSLIILLYFVSNEAFKCIIIIMKNYTINGGIFGLHLYGHYKKSESISHDNNDEL